MRERLLKINDPTEHNRKQFKEMRNLVISLQRQSERKYYIEQVEINEHDLRKSWKILKHIIGKEERSQTRKLEFNINNRVTSDSYSIANHFNNYFVNVGKTLAEKKCYTYRSIDIYYIKCSSVKNSSHRRAINFECNSTIKEFSSWT